MWQYFYTIMIIIRIGCKVAAFGNNTAPKYSFDCIKLLRQPIVLIHKLGLVKSQCCVWHIDTESQEWAVLIVSSKCLYSFSLERFLFFLVIHMTEKLFVQHFALAYFHPLPTNCSFPLSSQEICLNCETRFCKCLQTY